MPKVNPKEMVGLVGSLAKNKGSESKQTNTKKLSKKPTLAEEALLCALESNPR